MGHGDRPESADVLTVGWRAPVEVAGLAAAGILAVQWLAGPTLGGAAMAMLVATGCWGYARGPQDRTATRWVSARVGMLLGPLAGAGYGLLGWTDTGLVDLVGVELALGALMVGLLGFAVTTALTLCGLDAAVTGRGGYGPSQ